MNEHNKDTNVAQVKKIKESEIYTYINAKRRNFIIFLVTLVGTLGPLSGNIYIPLIPQLSEDFHVTESVVSLSVSVFMVVFAFAPIFWSTYSDYGGRKPLMVYALLIFIIANILLSTLPPNIAVLFIFRIFQAIGSSTLSVGVGVVADICEPKVRGRAISFFFLGPQIGPILGPILSIIGTKVSWRWTFGFLAILGAILCLILVFFLPETLRFLVGKGGYLKKNKSWVVIRKLKQEKIENGFPRPPKPNLKNYIRLIRKPAVFICSLCGSLVFASFYAFAVTFSGVLQKIYQFKPWQASVAYLCPGSGLILGSLLSGHISDFLRCQTQKARPEDRFVLQLIGIFFLTAACLGYGWLIHFKVYVASVFIFTFLSAFGSTWVLSLNTIYLSECSTEQPATYVSIGNMGRNIGATISSAIIHPLIIKMGYGWCFTGISFVSVFCGFMSVYLTLLGKK